MQKVRKSNFELLRLMSMLMVLNVHTFTAPDDLDILTMGGGNFARLLIDFFREASSISCVNLFVLISGYFSIKWKVRSISSLIFQVYFWIFLVAGISLIIGHSTISISKICGYLMGIMNGYWFVGAYLGLYILAPILNAFVEKSTMRQFKWYIIIFYIFFTIDALPYSTGYTNSGYSIYSFVGLYLIGQYIKRSDVGSLSLFQSKSKILLCILGVTLLIAISGLAVCAIFHRGGADLQLFPLSPIAYNNPLVIVQSILIFMFFYKLNIKSNFINWCAAGALAIYLFHMHPDIKQDYYGFARALYDESVFTQYLSIITLFIAIAIIAIPVDKLRAWIFDRLYNYVAASKIFNRHNGIN